MSTTDCNRTVSVDCQQDANVGLSLMALCLGVILALSVAANGMVCFVFYRKSNLLSISNSFVLNLSCSELALSILVLPFTLTSVFSSSGWVFNDIWCKIQGFIFSVCVFSIQFSLMIISLDRNYAIINSLRYVNVFTQKLANILIGLCWLLSIVLASLLLLNWGTYDYIPSQYTCAINWEESNEFLISVCIIVFLLPLSIQSICYLSIFKAAISHTKRSSRVYPSMPSSIRGITTTVQDLQSDSSDISDVSQNVQVKYQTMECKAVRTILLIAFTYAICWVPYITVSILRLRSVTIVSSSDSAAVCFVFLTGVINPVIYVFMNRVMRFEINKFFCGPTTRESRKSSTCDENDDFYSTTTMSLSVPKTTTTSSSSSSCQTRSSGGKSRRIEMKTIKEEELELGNVLKPVQLPSKHQMSPEKIRKDFEDKTSKQSELYLNPSDLYLQRRRIRMKHARLMSIREEATIPAGDNSSSWQCLEDLDMVWSPAVINESPVQYKRRRSRANSLGLQKDETFSKRRRDSGSFLYFEHCSPSKLQHGQNRRSGRGLSVDEAFMKFDNVPRRKQYRHHSLFEGMPSTTTMPIPDAPRPHSSYVFSVSNHIKTCQSDLSRGRSRDSLSDPELNRMSPSNPNVRLQTSCTDDKSAKIFFVSSQRNRDCLSA
ncbi:octopamine receptor beta-2R-like [Ylistrum balloti]|uniref:octopamine receptor beta-2R-like n=1 Tax=Ylistrum balloti TaxID=509963 RepID=UPI002905C9E9|nr:octopamine receptor beta-2R-like [Ylistrum balloti]